MPLVGFESTIPVFERANMIQALDRAAGHWDRQLYHTHHTISSWIEGGDEWQIRETDVVKKEFNVWAAIIDCSCKEVPINPILKYEPIIMSRQPYTRGSIFKRVCKLLPVWLFGKYCQVLGTRHDVSIGNWIHWKLVTTKVYNVIISLHILQFTTAYAKSS
jgi:hypothetical protein